MPTIPRELIAVETGTDTYTLLSIVTVTHIPEPSGQIGYRVETPTEEEKYRAASAIIGGGVVHDRTLIGDLKAILRHHQKS